MFNNCPGARHFILSIILRNVMSKRLPLRLCDVSPQKRKMRLSLLIIAKSKLVFYDNDAPRIILFWPITYGL